MLQKSAVPISIAHATQPSTRVEVLQHAFNQAVGALLDETRANSSYEVSYQPAAEIDGKVCLQLRVLNQRTWAEFTVQVESAKEGSFTMKSGNHTSHMPAALLPQGLSVIHHGILALRPRA